MNGILPTPAALKGGAALENIPAASRNKAQIEKHRQERAAPPLAVTLLTVFSVCAKNQAATGNIHTEPYCKRLSDLWTKCPEVPTKQNAARFSKRRLLVD
jgi:hypothetical protein